jgi:hypothetical protein
MAVIHKGRVSFKDWYTKDGMHICRDNHIVRCDNCNLLDLYDTGLISWNSMSIEVCCKCMNKFVRKNAKWRLVALEKIWLKKIMWQL